jgi:hypothetical protein
VPDHAGERITHSPVVTLCLLAERDLASGNSNLAAELDWVINVSETPLSEAKARVVDSSSGTPEGVPFQNNC